MVYVFSIIEVIENFVPTERLHSVFAGFLVGNNILMIMLWFLPIFIM